VNETNRERAYRLAYRDPTATHAISNISRAHKQPQSVRLIRQKHYNHPRIRVWHHKTDDKAR